MKTTLFILFIALLSMLSIDLKAQSGWIEGAYYQKRGPEQVQCDSTFYRDVKDPFFGVQKRGFHNCRKMFWTQKRVSTFVYIWSELGWYQKWYMGKAWSFRYTNYTRQLPTKAIYGDYNN
jgi:hypothetical protein